MKLKILKNPDYAKTGRKKIAGTVLSDDLGGMCVLVRLCFSLAEDDGCRYQKRVELWVALTQEFTPVIVRGIGDRKNDLEWSLVNLEDVSRSVRFMEILDSVSKVMKYRSQMEFVCGESIFYPTSIFDRRVVLPDDPRWPKTNKIGYVIDDLLKKRNDCPDDDVWILDAQILNFSFRDL